MVHVQDLSLNSKNFFQVKVHHKHKISTIPDFFGEGSLLFEKYLKIPKCILVNTDEFFVKSRW